jgi:hypothetical protein
MVTIVTSLYDINRRELDGRSWDTYLEWFGKTLELKSPMVIFVDSSTADFVEKCRSGLPTKIIVEPLEKSPYYHMKERMDSIIGSPEYPFRVKDTNRIECKSSLYDIVQFSKFGWVERAAEMDFFGTDLFLWLDAGISRFFGSLGIPTDIEYPGKNSLSEIGNLEDKMYLQMFMSSYPDLSYATDISEDYLRDNRSYVAGGIFMASKKSIGKIKESVDRVLLDLMLDNKIVNNEQIVLGYLIKKEPEMFSFFRNYIHMHRDYEVLRYLSK